MSVGCMHEACVVVASHARHEVCSQCTVIARVPLDRTVLSATVTRALSDFNANISAAGSCLFGETLMLVLCALVCWQSNYHVPCSPNGATHQRRHLRAVVRRHPAAAIARP